MTCTGCGSEEHFYKECNNPNKEQYRAKKLKMIAEMKRDKQKPHLRSFFMQIQGELQSDDDEDAKNDDANSTANHRLIAEELSQNLKESFFMEHMDKEEAENELAYIFLECMANITRHAFFGTQTTSFSLRSKNVSTLETQKLHYPPSRFFSVVVENGSTGSLCSVAQLEAYRKFSGNPTPVRKLKDHSLISAHGSSKCVGIGRFKLPYGDSVIVFDAPIVEILIHRSYSDSSICISYNQEEQTKEITLSHSKMGQNSS